LLTLCWCAKQYAFGENEAYDTSRFLEGSRTTLCNFGLRKVNTVYFTGFRSWLQHKFKLGIPIFFGRSGVPFGLVPKKNIKIGLEVGGIYFSGLSYPPCTIGVI
jgi:hypothetical protein